LVNRFAFTATPPYRLLVVTSLGTSRTIHSEEPTKPRKSFSKRKERAPNMLIKVNDKLYLNTELISSIDFSVDTEFCQVTMNNGDVFNFTQNEANGLIVALELGFSDTNDAVISFSESVPFPTSSTKSKIAQMLRDTWKGITAEQITAICHDVHDPSITFDKVESLIDELVNENVAYRIPQYDGEELQGWLIYHASSSEVQEYRKELRATPILDPLPASAESESVVDPAVDSEHSIDH
jgi:hypothetical protein